MFSGDEGAGYHAMSADVTKQDNLTGQISDAEGQTKNYQAQEQTLANQLQDQANGNGPNPALDQLHQTTDQNIKQATGMVASQKGMNAGMAARLAAQNASSANQQAAGQAAVMRANQQLQSENALGNVESAMTGQSLQQQNTLQTALANQNSSVVSSVNGQNSANSGVAQQNAAGQWGMFGGAMNAAGAALAMSNGGVVPTPGSSKGIDPQTLMKLAPYAMALMAEGGKVPGHAPVHGDSPKNDVVPVMLSPGELVIPRSAASDPNKAKKFIEHIMDAHADAHEPSYGELFQASKELKAKQAALEAKINALKGKK
jgi:hypothetical protein